MTTYRHLPPRSDLFIRRVYSTGVQTGLDLQINASDPATFDITPGQYQVVDNFTDPNATDIIEIQFGGLTGVALPDIAIQPVTFIGVNADSEVVLQAFPFSAEQRRDIVTLGAAVHPNGVTISSMNTAYVGIVPNVASTLLDYYSLIGPVRITGLDMEPSTLGPLQLKTNAGSAFVFSARSRDTPKDPNTFTVPELDGSPLAHIYRDPAAPGGFSNKVQVDLDVGFWDDGSGTLQSVGISRWSIYYVVRAETLVILHYGQAEYKSLGDALISLQSERRDFSSVGIDGTGFLGYIIVRGSCSDLSDPAQAQFIRGGLFDPRLNLRTT